MNQANDFILLKGGSVVNHDVQIEGETIKDIGLGLSIPKTARIMDVTDRYALPDGVDHAYHLSDATLENKLADSSETGSPGHNC